LSVFSLVGFLRTAPHLLYYLFSRGFYESVRKTDVQVYARGTPI
jgi:hypothetical protein